MYCVTRRIFRVATCRLGNGRSITAASIGGKATGAADLADGRTLRDSRWLPTGGARIPRPTTDVAAIRCDPKLQCLTEPYDPTWLTGPMRRRPAPAARESRD